jgi:hypothetical protein
MATKIQLRRDTAADWTSNNPTLAAGEFGWESDTNRFKIGDGATAWTSLAYASDGDTAGITFVGDDSTGTLVSQNETFKIAGGTGITTAVSGDTMTITASGGGGTITALNNQAENRLVSIGSTTTELDGEANLTFDGSTLTVTGAAALDGVTITDNSIKTNRSNDQLNIGSNGTGRIGISKSDQQSLSDFVATHEYHGSAVDSYIKGTMILDRIVDQPAITAPADRQYSNAIVSEWKLASGVNSADSDNRFRTLSVMAAMDMNAGTLSNTSASRGPIGADVGSLVTNTSASASTLGSTVGLSSTGYVSNQSGSGLITVNNLLGYNTSTGIYSGGGDITVDNAKGIQSSVYDDGGSGTRTITNAYGFFVNNLDGTNKYGFYDSTGSLSVFGDIQTSAVSITDNVITTNRSNDDLNFRTNGTGHVVLQLSDDDFFSDPVYTEFQGANTRQVGFISHVEEDVNTDTTGRRYQNLFNNTLTLTGSSSSNSDFRPRNFMSQTNIDMAGFSYTRTGFFRGPLAGTATVNMVNSSATASTMENVRGWTTDCGAYAGSGTYSAGDITMNNIYGMASTISSANEGGGAGTFTVTNGYSYAANHYCTAGGITNYYGFIYIGDNGGAGGNPTNRYAFYDNENVLSRFGAVILANQASDPSGVTDSAHIYAKDDAGSSEVYVRDEAGNVTKISPHNDAGEWEYYSVNKNTGKKVRVNMEKMIRKLEEFTGETFIESE